MHFLGMLFFCRRFDTTRLLLFVESRRDMSARYSRFLNRACLNLFIPATVSYFGYRRLGLALNWMFLCCGIFTLARIFGYVKVVLDIES